MRQLLKKPGIRYLLYLLAVMPAFLLRDFTLNNELRYLSIADEALRNGSFFTFTNHGALYADKPPLYLWIVMGGKLLWGQHSLAFLGMFSFLPALAILYIMDCWLTDYLPRKQRLEVEMMLLTSAFFIGTALVLRMDMLMCLFIVLSLYIFYKWHSGPAKPSYPIVFPLCVFMALFTKGPLGLIIPLAATAVFLWIKKEIRTMGRYWGIRSSGILILLCGLWFYGVYAEGGKEYINELLFHQTLNRAVNSFHHQQPVYYYLLSFWYSLFPWSLLIGAIIGIGMLKRMVSGDLELFFLVIILSTFVLLSLFSSKLAVYLLPAFPFIIALSVLWLHRLVSAQWALPALAFPALLFCLALPGAFIVQYFDFNTTPLVVLAAVILSATGYFTLIYLKAHRMRRAIMAMSAGMLLSVFSFSLSIPRYNEWIGLARLCQTAKGIARQQGKQNYYYCKILRADNLDVYLGVVPRRLRIKDLYHEEQTIRKPALLFLENKVIQRSDSIRRYIKGRPMHHSGNYSFVEIE